MTLAERDRLHSLVSTSKTL